MVVFADLHGHSRRKGIFAYGCVACTQRRTRLPTHPAARRARSPDTLSPLEFLENAGAAGGSAPRGCSRPRSTTACPAARRAPTPHPGFYPPHPPHPTPAHTAYPTRLPTNRNVSSPNSSNPPPRTSSPSPAPPSACKSPKSPPPVLCSGGTPTSPTPSRSRRRSPGRPGGR